eukprot:UN31035
MFTNRNYINTADSKESLREKIFYVIEKTVELFIGENGCLNLTGSKTDESLIILTEGCRWICELFDQIELPELRRVKGIQATKLVNFVMILKKLLEMTLNEHRHIRNIEQHRKRLIVVEERLSLFIKTLGIMMSEPELHKRQAIYPIMNYLWRVVQEHEKHTVKTISNVTWCIYILSISPSYSIYDNLHTGTNEWCAHLIHLFNNFGKEEINSLITTMLRTYDDHPSLLAKLFRLLANMSCVENGMTEAMREEVVILGLKSMKKYPNHCDVQSKVLALFVNCTEVLGNMTNEVIMLSTS